MRTDLTALHKALRAEQERRKRMVQEKAKCEEDLLHFIRVFWHVVEPRTPFVDGWPLSATVDALMAVTDGHITRLIENIFPGGMKSLSTNAFWPAWEWGPCNLAHYRYICASRQIYLTERDNLRFLRIISDPVYQQMWGDRVTLDLMGVSNVTNKQTGWKLATSIGSLTGARGNRVIIDDPNSTDPREIESETQIRAINGWLTEVMPDRLNDQDKDAIILIQQRTGLNDATSVLAQHGYTWLMIPWEFDPLRCFPVTLRWNEDGSPADQWVDPRSVDEDGSVLDGIFTDDKGKPQVRMGSPMAKAMGTPAWPERWSDDAIAALKKIKGPWAFQSQYQQEPVVRGGEIIRRDWWQLWPHRSYPAIGTVIASLDTAMEEKSTNDYNALTIWGAFEGPTGAPQLILMDAWRDRLPLSQLVARVAEKCFKHKVDYLLVEHKTRGRDVHDELRRIYQNATWQTILIKVDASKMARLQAVSGLFSGDVKRMPVPGQPGEIIDTWSGGMVWAPDKDWCDEVIEEVCAFPRGANDDFVDTVSMALAFVRKNGVVVRKIEYEEIEREKLKFRKSPGVPYAIGRK